MLQEREATAAPAPEAGRSPSQFATTHWTMVVRAGKEGSVDGHRALEELCRVYWPPLYAFARRQGKPAQDAEDAVQAFFEDMLSRDAIAAADASRGRFRTFLIASFRNFDRYRRRSETTMKRGGDREVVSYESIRALEGTLLEELATEETPERVYDRKWAGRMLAEVFTAVGREYASASREALFEELRRALWGGRRTETYAVIAGRLAMTEVAVKLAAHRLKKRVAEQFRIEVAKTVVDPEDVEDELRHLLAVVST